MKRVVAFLICFSLLWCEAGEREVRISSFMNSNGCDCLAVYTTYDCELCLNNTALWLSGKKERICVMKVGKDIGGYDVMENPKWKNLKTDSKIYEIVLELSRKNKFPVVLEIEGVLHKVCQ